MIDIPKFVIRMFLVNSEDTRTTFSDVRIVSWKHIQHTIHHINLAQVYSEPRQTSKHISTLITKTLRASCYHLTL